jgi:ABC-2 type transport system ATP-binding protein
MDDGRLQFSEDMAGLTQRFREVEVTLDAPPTLPGLWPGHWLRPETSAAVARFVETHFDQERTFGEVRTLFHGITGISANPMPLRAIFVTLARSSHSSRLSGETA